MKLGTHVLLLVVTATTLVVQAMLSKRSSYVEKQGNAMPSEKRFRANVADLFLSNDISGNRVLELVQDHASSDQSCVNNLLTVGISGRHKNNVSRDLLRKLKKGTAWPALYWAENQAV